ncbi:ATP-binding protein [Calothrix sp. PCC 6303]|uniref:PAS domain-containing sensor histidine kinase n=1 Tax=Calothrix sp. PCC 6303 TaxID=1170562 RepID=UPI0002A04F42|nr:ATP-binding protein [Calothrix sp. PCC 6303]AFZ03731.1 PAS/PAC sensor signal transduction histidine kinase [Calothrix sp. PCC 6303]
MSNYCYESRFFFELTQVLPEPLILIDIKGNFISANNPAADIFGVKRKDLLLKNILDFVSESHTQVLRYIQTCSTSRAIILGSFKLRIANEEVTTYRSQGAVVQPWTPESDAQILLRLEKQVTANNNFALLNRKIDELAQEVHQRRQAEIQLALANQELEKRVEERTNALQEALSKVQMTQAQLVQSEKMSGLGQIVAGMAHEINNPIGFIHGNIIHAQSHIEDLLNLVLLYQKNLPNPPEEIQDYIESIDLDYVKQDLNKILDSMCSGTNRIKELVKSLRVFSRFDEAEFKKVNVHDGIDSVLMIIEHKLFSTKDDIKIKIVKQYGDIPLVTCYPSQLNQVFLNVLTNAIDVLKKTSKFSNIKSIKKFFIDNYEHQQLELNEITTTVKDGNDVPTIWIRTELVEENKILVTIADNGTGIPEDIRHKVFDPFFTTKAIGKGTGLGLSTSYHIIVEKHQGKLCFNSVMGEGSQFFIEIPLNLKDK